MELVLSRTSSRDACLAAAVVVVVVEVLVFLSLPRRWRQIIQQKTEGGWAARCQMYEDRCHLQHWLTRTSRPGAEALLSKEKDTTVAERKDAWAWAGGTLRSLTLSHT